MWPGDEDLGLEAGDRFGRDHDVLGDVNGDGVVDFVVGARSDDDGAVDAGAIFVVFPDESGEIEMFTKISATAGGFEEVLEAGDFFGYGVAGLGDVDGDGVPDLACTSPMSQRLFTILLHPDGTVKATTTTPIPSSQGLSSLGDLNGDDKIDLALCDPMAAIGGPQRGAVHVYFGAEGGMFAAGPTWGSPAVALQNGDRFGGREAEILGDLDGDGTVEVAVGAFGTAGETGAVWLLSVNAAAEVAASQMLGDGLLNLTPAGQFGHAITSPGDLDGDGLPDLLVGANLEPPAGALHFLRLSATGQVLEDVVLSEALTGIPFGAVPNERMTRSMSFAENAAGNGESWWVIGGGAGTTGNLRIVRTRSCPLSAHEPTSATPIEVFSAAGHPSQYACECLAATSEVPAMSWNSGSLVCSGYAEAGNVEGAGVLSCLQETLKMPNWNTDEPRIVCGIDGVQVRPADENWDIKIWDGLGRQVASAENVSEMNWSEGGQIWFVHARRGQETLRAACPNF
jgi:hypothetical protein